MTKFSGQALGVVGGGQLGRMFVQEAVRMGFRVVVLEPDAHSPAGALAHVHLQAAYTDEAALKSLAEQCHAITTEFENVPAASLEYLAQFKPVRPGAASVAIAQDRVQEKAYFRKAGVPVAPNMELQSAADCQDVPEALFPGILKTARMGYDGRGQVQVADRAALKAAFAQLGGVRCLLESKLALQAEMSILIARGADGACVHLPAQQNLHRGGILAVTQVPLSAELAGSVDLQSAYAQAQQIAVALDYVGVLCIEFFVLADGRLVANEIAPRPHNSGHASIEAASPNQFELQVRTLAGLPLVEPEQQGAAVMLNLLGDLWHKDGTLVEPDFAAVLALQGVALHLYDKREARVGRKMGHLTITARNPQIARERALRCCQLLGIEPF